MRFIFFKNLNTKNGFSLVEVMAAIGIIAILTTTFLPKVSGYFDEANKVTIAQQAKNVITAHESIKHSLPSQDENITITSLAQKYPNLLPPKSYDKLSENDIITISHCHNYISNLSN